MTRISRWLVMLCIVTLFIAVGGCSGGDDAIQIQHVSADQAVVLIEGAAPYIFEFGPEMVDLLKVVSVGKSGDLGRRAACTPVPGLESEFFCADPGDGNICPVNGMTNQWLFSECVTTNANPGTFDGRVTVTEAGNAFELNFDLDVDGASRNGLLMIEMGEPCATLSYSGFVIDDGDVSTTIDGTNTICPEGLSGTLNVAVNATGIPRFLMEIVLFQGVPTILVLNPSTSTPLYTCSFDPPRENAQCSSYSET